MKGSYPFQNRSILCLCVLAFAFLSEAYWASEGQKVSGDSNDAAKPDGKVKKVYTNEDLEDLRKTQPINQPAPSGNQTTSSGASVTNLEKYRDIQGHDREYWQKKIHPLRNKVNLLDSKIAALENNGHAETVSSGINVSKSGKLHTKTADPQAKLQKKIDDLKLQRTQVFREIEYLEDQARKAHALPEWLR